MPEVWKAIKQNKSYEISNYGNLRRLKTNGEYFYHKGAIQKTNGYKYANITDLTTKKRRMLYLHNLVLEQFKGARPEETADSGRWVCDHINRDKLDNRIENLRYVREIENLRNNPNYHSNIATNDRKERERILRAWRKKHPDQVKKRSKCGHIKQIGENKYWCIVNINKKRYKKTVKGDYQKAQQYCNFMKEYYS